MYPFWARASVWSALLLLMELGFLTKGFLNPSRLHLLEPIVLNQIVFAFDDSYGPLVVAAFLTTYDEGPVEAGRAA